MDNEFRLDGAPERRPRIPEPVRNHLIQGAADPLQSRIDRLLAGRVPPRIRTRVRTEDMIIVTRALGQFTLLATSEDDEAILDLTEEQRTLLVEVRVEWWDV